ncbi:signal peptidase I [Phytohalomonas tamaricis]|uniref:signal peptidase I n=1 Tax=Phytohalomonas tamaricis TaxID=2081032 RepID=UPI000D0B2392|nr:signal peptidase I [Phytohalomonas tamaricis]
MDFSLVLVVAVAISGLIWLMDIVFWRRARREQLAAAEANAGQSLDEKSRQKVAGDPWYVDYARSFFPVLLLVLVLRSFLIEPFQIPSGSMRPTLEVGDYIVVNKFTYGLRLPVVNTKFIDIGEPERGDVMVFRFPQDPSVNFIKRVIGLPGDRIRYEGKQLYINDEPVEKDLLLENPPENPGEELYQEYLGDVEHPIYNNPQDAGPQMREVTVPPGYYFMMGDNRDHSNDSRYWGFVPEENIVGKAFAVWMHWQGSVPDFSSVRLIH